MVSKVRARGEKEPTGRTKSAILLYLADHGESTFTQIRQHLLEQYNIKSSKDVRLHLDGLAADDRLALLLKIPHGNGNACSYRIREGFPSLKRLHNFLNEHGAVPSLMKTRYFGDYTASTDFIFMVRANIIRNSMLDLYDNIMDDRGYAMLKSLLQDVDDTDRKALIEWMDGIRANDRNEAMSGSFLSLIDMLKSWDSGMMSNVLINIDLSKIQKAILAAPEEFSILMSELVIPESQRKMVLAILQLSPASLDYLLNSKSNNPLFPPNVFLAYIFSRMVNEPSSGRSSVDFSSSMKYTAMLPRISREPPIVLIARSLFVSDMVYGRLTVDEVPEETLRLLFS